MTQVVDFLLSRGFAAVASLSSVSSLLLTFAVFFGVRRIRKHYAFTARIPELTERLSTLASRISSLLDSGSSDATSMHETLAEAEVTLKSLRRKIGGSVNAEAKGVVKQINALQLSGSNRTGWFAGLAARFNERLSTSREDQIRLVYISLYKITSECKEAYQDARWEPSP